MSFYTTVLRRSNNFWVTLCLENGLVGQGQTREEAIEKLKEAIASWEEGTKRESDVYSAPVSVKELHEFLTLETPEPITEALELRAVYA